MSIYNSKFYNKSYLRMEVFFSASIITLQMPNNFKKT